MKITGKSGNLLNSPYVFILLTLFMFVAFIVYPVCFTFMASIHQWDGVGPMGKLVWFRNYADVIFRDQVFHKSLFNTLKLVAGATILQIGVAIGIALLVANLKRGRTFFRTAFFLPCIMSLVTVGLLWNWIYHPLFGIVTKLLNAVGLSSLVTVWLGDPRTALPAVLLAYSWQSIGIFMVILLAGIQSIPESFYEVASLEGAGWWRTLTMVTLPSLRPQLFISIMLCTVFTLKLFPLVYIMTMGGPAYATEILGLTVYRYAFRFYSTDKASAISFILILIVIVVSNAYTRLLKKEESELVV